MKESLIPKTIGHSLHDPTCPWEEVRATGRISQTSGAALQETHQDHNPDSDPEFAAHKFITKSLGAFTYFAVPYAS